MKALPDFKELYRRSDTASSPIGVAAAGGADETVLQALSEAAQRGWVDPIVCGNENEIRRLCDQLQLDVNLFRIVHSETPAYEAVAQIHQGQARLMMKGQIPTPELMKAILDQETGLRTGQVISQMVLMEIPRDRKTFLMTDTGITIRPDLIKKQQMLDHLMSCAMGLGCTHPKIAIMAATEKINDAMPETLDAEPLMEYAKQQFAGRCDVSGPLSFDLAYASQAGARKRLNDPVIGDADGMLFPDLLSANLTVKAIMYTADCRFGGLLCGTSAPVVFMSRADDTMTRLNSLALTLEMLRQHN